MTLTAQIMNPVFKQITRILCRIDDSHWEKIPGNGPLLLIVNHINFIEVPIMYTHLLPRPLTGFVKAENWEKPFTRWLFTMWNAIPLQRGEADMSAIRAGLAALSDGKILTVAPEGTRTGDGRLLAGHPGMVTMALKAKAPLLPVAYYGTEMLWDNVRHLRRTDFHMKVGQLFYLDDKGQRVTRGIRQQMADEIMVQLARLLPEPYRGHYADQSAWSEEFLHFDTP